MYCSKCGFKNDDNALYCKGCGVAVRNESEVENSEEVASNVHHSLEGWSESWSIGKLFSGRLGRMRYFQGVLISFLPFFLTVSLWGFIHIFTGIYLGNDTSPSFLVSLFNNVIIPLVFAVEFLLFFPCYFTVTIRRCHDIGASGWLSLCVLIPYVGAILGLVLLFKKGDAMTNTYGSPPAHGRKFWADIFNY